MKKLLIVFTLIVTILCDATSINVHAAARTVDYYSSPQRIRATCYKHTGITKSGQPTREGVIAGREEWLGCTALLYSINEDGTIGSLIGYYEFLDTGGTAGLNNGTVIDVWVDGMDGVNEWISTYGDYVYLQIVRAQG